MKFKLASLILLIGVLPAAGSVTLTTAFGTAYAADGSAVANGTLWVLVGDTNGDSSFGGVLELNSSLDADGANEIFKTGDTLTLGTDLSGDTVFAMGGFNADGTSFDIVNLTLGENGVSQNMTFAFFWFADVVYDESTSLYVIGSEVGGIHSNVDADALGDMVIPSDGSLLPTGAGTEDGAGGTLTAAQFTAVQLVPEPSTALLGALGALGLLRRRR